MTRLVAADIGGTHARFALATVEPGGSISLADPVTLTTADHAGVEQAWAEFAERAGEALPADLAIAFAGSVAGEQLSLTNSHWSFEREALRRVLGLDRLLVINDFGAVAHALQFLPPEALPLICGPDEPFSDRDVVSIVGPGTGLGIAALLRAGDGDYHAIQTEGGHFSFAPVDPLEDRILVELRRTYGRVSVERILSGRGLGDLYRALAVIGGGSAQSYGDDKALWTAALDAADPMAAEALDHFLAILGSVAGDVALAQGAAGVAIGGGLGLRLKDRLAGSRFCARFVDKGRYRSVMEKMPVRLIAHPQPGLLGAAAAFASQHLREEPNSKALKR